MCGETCNCVDCSNNPNGEDERREAMNAILDRNPQAFKPKFSTDTSETTTKHLIGCHCKRSN
jgi:hypothetical protein